MSALFVMLGIIAAGLVLIVVSYGAEAWLKRREFHKRYDVRRPRPGCGKPPH